MFDSREYYKRYYQDNKEKILGQTKQYRIDNPEQKKQWDIDNKERQGKYYKQYNVSHKEKRRNQLEQWRKNNPEKVKEYNSKRRQLGFFSLNKYFEDSEGHHISENFVIYIPKAIHQNIKHSIWSWKNMNKINKLAIEYL